MASLGHNDLMVSKREIVIPWYLCIWQQQLAVFRNNICWIQHAGSIPVTLNWFHASAHRLPEIWTLREEPHRRTLTHWSLDVMMPINNFEHNLVVYILSILSDIVPILTGDTIWWQRSGSIVAQVMACCLTALNHFLTQCYHTIKGVLWHWPESNYKKKYSWT